MYPRIDIVRILSDNYAYLVRDRSTKNVAIVDPGEAKPVIDYVTAEKLAPVEIWLTHKHEDHIKGAAFLAEKYDIPVRGPSEIPDIRARFTRIRDGDVFHFGASPVAAHEIRGHTGGHLVYLFNSVALTGDVLFIGGCGRIFEGTAAELYRGIAAHLRDLPAHTRIYCGHDYAVKNLLFALQLEPDNAAIQKQYERMQILASKGQPSVPGEMGIERATNPFLRTGSPSLRAALERRTGTKIPADPEEVFTLLRRLRDES